MNKTVDSKRISIIIFSIVLGICFAAYLLYDQRGIIGQSEVVILTLTAIIAFIIAIVIIKKANK